MSSRTSRWFAGLAAALMSAGCGELPPAQSVPPPAVASVTVSPGAPSIMVGTTVQLSAITKDAQGNILGSRTITWSSSAVAVATVSATGLVTGVSAGGPVTITATSEGQLGTAQVTVTPDAVATSLTALTSTTLSGFAGTPVFPPSVRVRDQRGAIMIGVTVTFAVASGGGSVTGGSATTNFAGVATVGSWILGATPGPNTLTASVTGLPSVTFAATGAVGTPCSLVMTHAVGTTTVGALDNGDCMSDGVFVDTYSITLSGVNAYRFRQSGNFDTYLWLGRPWPSGTILGILIAENDDENIETTNSVIKALLPGGSYVVAAGSYEWGATGAYSLSSEITSTEVSGCEVVYVVRGVATAQNIQPTDCLRTNGPAYADEFSIYLKAGDSLTLSMTSTAVDAFLELILIDPVTGVRNSVAFNDNLDTSGTNARLVYTASIAGYYKILASTALNAQTGGYTLTIQ